MEFEIGYKRENDTIETDGNHMVEYSNNHKPCKGAYQKEGILIRESMSINQNYVDLKFYPAFTAEGINHRISNNGSKSYLERQMPDETWYVELNSLEELLALQDEIGRPIIINHYEAHGLTQHDYDTGKWIHSDIPKRYYITIKQEHSYVVLD